MQSRDIDFVQKRCARTNLVPVFIFTNEDPEHVKQTLPNDVYQDPPSGTSVVFVGRKNALWVDGSVAVEIIEQLIYSNASVYALRTWDQVLGSAKRELFAAMCARSVDWPRVFWTTYVTDGAEPSSSLTNLISASLRGRMRMGEFKHEHLGGNYANVPGDELRGLIAETSFRSGDVLPPDEVRCGDLYEGDNKKYLMNVRPDCDCIPRDDGHIDAVELYCVAGKRLKPGELRKKFRNGHVEERVFESVVFAVIDGKSILFNFKELSVVKYSEVKGKRVGRLLHPYMTRVQQRYALYVPRQALPRIPDAAVLHTGQ